MVDIADDLCILDKWIEELNDVVLKNAVKVIACSKYDVYEESDEHEKKVMKRKLEKLREISQSIDNCVLFTEISSKTGYNVEKTFKEITRNILFQEGIFCFVPWKPNNKELDEMWGKGFREIVMTLLLSRKYNNKSLPKPIVFKILIHLSEIYCEEETVPWIREPPKSNQQKEPPNQTKCLIN